MSILEEKSLQTNEQEKFLLKNEIITNSFFLGSQTTPIRYFELSERKKEFVILLLSYELNFQPNKLDYYFRTAKRLQFLFQIPGWKLLLPNSKEFTKSEIRKNIIELANEFKSDIHKKKFSISLLQASALNKAYKNFLWE